MKGKIEQEISEQQAAESIEQIKAILSNEIFTQPKAMLKAIRYWATVHDVN